MLMPVMLMMTRKTLTVNPLSIVTVVMMMTLLMTFGDIDG